MIHEGSRDAGSLSRPLSTTFEALGVSPSIVELLRDQGITEAFPIQVHTIPDALAGRDVCGKARTGSGKTLAFGLPLIERTRKSKRGRPESLVLVPTRELAGQVVAALDPLAAEEGLRVLAVYGGVSLYRQARALQNGVDIVVATPGRLNDLLRRGDVSIADVKMVVLDEADQMADLGFMPQVEQILRQIDGQHQTLLFSATLDGAVDRLVQRYQHNPVFHEVQSPKRDTITMKHRFIGVTDAQRTAVTADISSGPGRTLLFVRTQRGAQRLVKQLSREGLEAGMLHGGMSQPQRERSLRAFADGSVPVLVATNIAARGIHVDGVDIVVHHDPPEDAKTYLHRSGRTARAGASGLVVTLVGPDQTYEVNRLRRQVGAREAVVPMSPGDARLTDLAGWTPPEEETSRGLTPVGVGAPKRNGEGSDRRPWGRRRIPRERGASANTPRDERAHDERPRRSAAGRPAGGSRAAHGGRPVRRRSR